MAEKKRGSYTAEFRQRAADLAMTSEVKRGDIAKTLNLVPSTLSNWVAKRKKQLQIKAAFDGSSAEKSKQLSLEAKNKLPSSQVEVDRLQREVKRLQQERKVIKEAIILLTT